ncbi:hypothetical protein LTR66_013871, partial [Elasticomyces elasticus]
MCRWFAYISPTEPCLLEDVLITPKHGLVKQVHEHFLPGLVHHYPEDIEKGDALIRARNSVSNIDGVGIAWYTSSNADYEAGETGASADGVAKSGLRPACYRTIAPPINDLNFRSICANTETRVLFAHIRAASATPIVHVNNHPFTFGRHIFMHNGVVSDFSAIKRTMCMKMSDAAHAGVLGGTDSEHIAALYMTHLTNGGPVESFQNEYDVQEMAVALHKAVADVLDCQETLLGEKKRPNSLNLCVTDGIKLVAYRFRNHSTQEPPSLYYSTKAGTTLNRKYPDNPDGEPAATSDKSRRPIEKHGKHIIIASEPSTYQIKDWHLIGRNQVLMASHEGKVQLHDIEIEDAWNAIDPSVDVPGAKP